jgi:hypothetical protein
VQFESPTAVLAVEAGCAFEGAVVGDGGTLLLASGTGKLSGLFAIGKGVIVSGSMAKTRFSDFGTVEVGSGATFADKGAVKVAAGQTVLDGGTLTLGKTGKTITNAGLIETVGTGVLTLAGAVANTGTLAADGGVLTVTGAASGSGSASIDGGTLDLASSFNEAVTFAGTTGVLELAHSQGYTGTITGFSTTGGTSLDLRDIGFVDSTEATFSGTTRSGVLTVTDGAHTAHVDLEGNYTDATFIASSDGHGGTIVVDPSGTPAHAMTATAPALHAFVAAIATLGAPDASAGSLIGHAWPAAAAPSLIAPRVQLT